MTTYEAKLRKRNNPTWKEHLKPSTVENFEKFLIRVIKERGDERGSYSLSLKIDGGNSKNPETGATLSFNWKGSLSDIGKMLKMSLCDWTDEPCVI
jgi:hypothetical protein